MASHKNSARKATLGLSAAFALALIVGLPAVRALAEETSDVSAAKEISSVDAERLFSLKVYPLLQAKCAGCHGADEQRGEFDVRTREALLAGGESGDPSVIPHNAADSILFQAVSWDGYEMPPKENDRLTPEQVEQVRSWINAGAPWPDDAARQRYIVEERSKPVTEDGVIVSTSGGLADEWTYRRYQPEDIWAYQPVKKPEPPVLAPSMGHPVDAFVDAKLSEAGLTAAPRAEPRDLIRRATFDLIGLPPTPEETDTFLAAYETDPEVAWASLIDRLLDSPHYGERWAQHWLDVARYADTGGLSNDYERSNAWRYRDWVVRSLNADMPYDEFVVRQIAGDELETPDPVPTGFLRMGPWDTAMIPKKEARQIFLDDVVHSVGQTFLSTPLRCCKCHDHKFDPIPTQDYYRIYASFAASQPGELPAEFDPEENRAGFDEEKALVEELLAFAKEKVKELTTKREAAARIWYEEHGLEYKDLQARKNDKDDVKPPRHVGLSEEEQGKLKVREQDVWIWTRRLERFEPMVQSVYNGQPGSVNARKLRPPKKRDAKWKPETRIHMGGSYEAPGDEVTPGVMSAVGVAVAENEADPFALTNDVEGRRLGLAKWIADENNSLTTRSIVNRIWQQHFGEGLVKTANNFGVKGDRPTHPLLLDWLAADLVENGWTLKRLHKLIMTSEAYRRSTEHPEADKLDEVDPSGKLLASFRPRRLSAEELRDAMLLASGELNPQIGGLPSRPEINREVALEPRMIQFSLAPAYQASRTPAERNRRSLYAYRVRGQPDPLMEVLGSPNPNDSCEMRDSAAVPPQAFSLFNGESVGDRAIALAVRVENEAEATDKRVNRMFRLVLGRPATEDERSRLTDYAGQMLSHHRTHEPEAVKFPTEVTRSLVEEFSGKPFEYTEILPTYKDYEPHAKPWSVSAETRALADVARVLFNSNEFAYVY